MLSRKRLDIITVWNRKSTHFSPVDEKNNKSCAGCVRAPPDFSVVARFPMRARTHSALIFGVARNFDGLLSRPLDLRFRLIQILSICLVAIHSPSRAERVYASPPVTPYVWHNNIFALNTILHISMEIVLGIVTCLFQIN